MLNGGDGDACVNCAVCCPPTATPLPTILGGGGNDTGGGGVSSPSFKATV